jgi:endonuclease YncB( thermonuclease family)
MIPLTRPMGWLAWALVMGMAVCLGTLITQNRAAIPPISGRASVVDGDTLRIADRRIRLLGIDAPEIEQECRHRDGTPWPCGQVARDALTSRVGSTNLTCRPITHDAYGRVVATCFQGTTDLARWLVSEGWAVAYRRYSTAYVNAEEEARRAHMGIWDGSFTRPASWRKSHTDARGLAP